MSRLILHRALGSPPARAVLMVGDILGIPFEIKEVNLVKGEHKTPEFTKMNPMKTVPVLQDGDFFLSESHAIMKYLVEKYGGEHRERLYPSELRTRALVDQCLLFDAGVFFTAFRDAAGTIFYDGVTEPTQKYTERINSAYEVIDTYLQNKPYIAADWLTLADLSAGSTITATQVLHKLDHERFPRCSEWMKRLEQETIFKNINSEGVKYFEQLVNFFVERNRKSHASQG